jgi:hypothetical protein
VCVLYELSLVLFVFPFITHVSKPNGSNIHMLSVYVRITIIVNHDTLWSKIVPETMDLVLLVLDIL